MDIHFFSGKCPSDPSRSLDHFIEGVGGGCFSITHHLCVYVIVLCENSLSRLKPFIIFFLTYWKYLPKIYEIK